MRRRTRAGAKRVVIDERIMLGKPIIKGTRVTVEAIIRRLAEGFTLKEVVEEYPKLNEEDVKAALNYAAKLISNEEIIPKVRIYA